MSNEYLGSRKAMLVPSTASHKSGGFYLLLLSSAPLLREGSGDIVVSHGGFIKRS